MRPSRPPSWGMAGSSISHGSWRAIRKPSVKVFTSWRRQRMRRLDAFAKKGGTPAARRRAANPRNESPPPLAGVHSRRSDARRRPVDEPVTARGVTPPGGAGNARQSAHDPTAAEKTQDRPPHGAEEKDDGPSY